MRICKDKLPPRHGVVAVELAILLPVLVFFAAIGVDFARVFSRTVILETASRNGAFYGCQDPSHAQNKAGIEAVVRRDLTDISPPPEVTSETYMGADGFQYVRVTVKYTFFTVMKVPGVPTQSQLIRYTDMRICPTYPKPGTF
jgi:Flp pilus assembly protein TadG